MSPSAEDVPAARPAPVFVSPDLERLDIVAVGHVDHGKSTVIGRLMADTGSLPEGKLDQVKAMCKINARPFEYAFLLDALKNEQAQGITIDTARCFFNTNQRHYIIHDAPGHVEFLKNMITGASRAQAALLVIDAQEGVRENSKRHGYILSMLGIRQIAVLVNKMDLLDWDQGAFDAVVHEYADFLARLGVRPASFIPVSARDGANIVARAAEAPWYDGPTVLEQVEAFTRLDDDLDRPFRMPLQDVYKFTEAQDDRRIFVGTIETGRVRPGDDVVFLPSRKHSTVKTIEALSGPRPEEASAGQATGLTLEAQVYAKPGELLVRADQTEPLIATRIRANVFWMNTAPLIRGRRYVLRMGAARVAAELESVLSVLDEQELESVTGAGQVERHDVAEVILRAVRPVAFDTADTLEPTSRFVIVHGHDIAGCGIALEALEDEGRGDVTGRRFRRGEVTEQQRATRYGHAGKAILFVAESNESAHDIAARVDRSIFARGVHSYCLSATDLGDPKDVLDREAHLGRVGEIAWAMTDAGIVLVAALGDVDRFDLDRLRRLAAPHEVFVVGVDSGAEIGADLELTPATTADEAAEEALRALTAAGVLPGPAA
ncbi:MAG: GTP-binding protein [Actinobacteria bacterium]|nr:GTP-binding protein [Actinomycetota bacterium]